MDDEIEKKHDQPARIDADGKSHYTMKLEPARMQVKPGRLRGWIKPPVDHEIYKLIGQVASDWAHLEKMLDAMICDLAEIEPKRGACVTAQLMGVWPRINSVSALLHYWTTYIPEFSSTIKALNKFGEACRGPSERRNRIIHDAWMFEVSTESEGKLVGQHRSMPRQTLSYGIEEVDQDGVQAFIGVVEGLNTRASAIKNEICDTLKAWREKHT